METYIVTNRYGRYEAQLVNTSSLYANHTRGKLFAIARKDIPDEFTDQFLSFHDINSTIETVSVEEHKRVMEIITTRNDSRFNLHIAYRTYSYVQYVQLVAPDITLNQILNNLENEIE